MAELNQTDQTLLHSIMNGVISFVDTIGGIGDTINLIGWITVLLVSTFFWRSDKLRHKYTKVFFPKDFNEFYSYFARHVRKAKSVIYHTGDGFNMKNPTSRNNADLLDKAFVEAMTKGVRVNRYQIVESMTINWLRRLSAYKNAFPDNFFVFINGSHEGIGSFCVIDPDTRNTIYEQQITTGKRLGRGTEPYDFAFIHGHQHKSDGARDLVEEIMREQSTVELKTSDDFTNYERDLFYQRLEEFKNNANYVLIDQEIIELTTRSTSIEEIQYSPDIFEDYPLPE